MINGDFIDINIEKIETLTQYIEYVDKLPLEFSLSRDQTIDKPLLPSGMRTADRENRIVSVYESVI